MATSARYCPFCGARLRDDGDTLADHLGDRGECREAFEDWDGADAGMSASGDERASLMRTFLMWVIIVVVLFYAFLIATEPLLGVLAAGVVYLAFRFTAPS